MFKQVLTVKRWNESVNPDTLFLRLNEPEVRYLFNL